VRGGQASAVVARIGSHDVQASFFNEFYMVRAQRAHKCPTNDQFSNDLDYR
jgi:hypothetical protein